MLGKKKLNFFLAFHGGAFGIGQTLLAHYDEIQSLEGPSLDKCCVHVIWEGWMEKIPMFMTCER